MYRKEINVEKCIGCGLCKTIFKEKVEMKFDKVGFIRPFLNAPIDQDLLEELCPVTTKKLSYSDKIWGEFINVYIGFSNNSKVRDRGSSGGILSQVLIYLIESKKVDGVIQIGASRINPLENEVYISRTKEQILENSGSRYAPAAPLHKLNEFLDSEETYAFVGKPCDIRALRTYESVNKQISVQIPYKISFFCAGTPSKFATEKLVRNLNVNLEDVKSLRYRGNGWPGFATIKDLSNVEHSMSYDDSWGKILGKDIQPYCRWCADGTGEFADISCGDGWYLTKEKKPDFSESKGRNVIFSRTQTGDQIIDEMKKESLISLEDFQTELPSLKYMQKYQFERKATMIGKIIALKLLMKEPPFYPFSTMISWAKHSSVHKNMRVFMGTIRRSLQRKI